MFIQILFLFWIWIKNSFSSNENSVVNLFPPSTNVYNVTGPLNSFVEQLQANSRSDESERTAVSSDVPVQNQQLYNNNYNHNNNNNQPSLAPVPVPVPVTFQPPPPAPAPPSQLQQPQPSPQIYSGPQNRPILDPALQQLLNSFNTNPNTFDFNRLSQQQLPQHPQYSMDINTPVVSVSYITCYVGCSHVTNIVSAPNEATPTVSKPNFIASIFFSVVLLFAYIL